MGVSGTESVVKFHVFPSSEVDISPPVASNSQLPVCPKVVSASLRTREISSQPENLSVYSHDFSIGELTVCRSIGASARGAFDRDEERRSVLTTTCSLVVSTQILAPFVGRLTGRDAGLQFTVDIQVLAPLVGGGIELVYDPRQISEDHPSSTVDLQCVLILEPGCAISASPTAGLEPVSTC